MSLYSYIQNIGFQVVRLKSDNSHPGVIYISGTKSRKRERERGRERDIYLITRLCSQVVKKLLHAANFSYKNDYFSVDFSLSCFQKIDLGYLLELPH